MEDDIVNKFKKVNEIFTEYIKIFPSLKLREPELVIGKHIKLNANLDGNPFDIASLIFFELHHILYHHSKRFPDDTHKMVVTELILSPIIPGSSFRRGYIIKIGYE